ncbi:hypothetical protein B5V01_13665 [Mesorhizobium erdmanii]|uniref:Ribbon-helix-helix protein, CopG family n=2 Tax=Mesorhizobium TaxID=68287 RepID=A0A3M9X0K6_9HYPH|nr:MULTISPECIES: hypothetical protein [Mesorhizobium]RNJ41554.1 hypothetical protein DNR46_33500 [Mesorhizobium japonicum]RXT45871.1 hypothetical protein B5V01_13665 [Mesorhizobium erdmanii]
MPTIKRAYRLQVMLNAKELAVLDAWRFERRLPSRAEAVRALLQRGLVAKGYDADRGALSVDFGVLKLPSE